MAGVARLREFHDANPHVFAGAIQRALQDEPAELELEQTSTPDAHRFYSRASACERLLATLQSYPRSLPFGSGDVTDAVIFTNAVVVAFLEAVLERRGQL